MEVPQKVTVEYDETTEQLIFLDENGQKVAAVRPSVFYHNPTKEEARMSRNDQLLVKEHRGKFYVFNVMAESWSSSNWPDSGLKNVLEIGEAKGVFDTREEAHKFAHELDAKDEWGGSEYGVIDEVLCKDGAPVTITED